MDATRPTKKQLATLGRVADERQLGEDWEECDWEEHSAYVMLHDGSALGCLYRDGKVGYVRVLRDGNLSLEAFSLQPLAGAWLVP